MNFIAETWKKMAIITVWLMTVSMTLSTPAMAEEFPLVAGDYSEVGGIYVKDGGTLKYARFLADTWEKNSAFAKSQGWISDFKIYFNVNPRDGEPNIYLMSTFPSLPDAAESQRRDDAFDAWANKTLKQQIAESGNRGEFRTVKSSLLLREYKVR